MEETIDEESREFVLLKDNTKQHCVCVGNYQEWEGYVGSGQESWKKSRKKGGAAIQHGRGKEEREWYIGVEQGRAGVLLHGGENWREVYNSKVQFSAIINGWENWESKDKSKKDAIRTCWTRDKVNDKKMSCEKNSPQEKHWWEEEDKGYNTDRDLMAEYDWEDKTIGKIKERLGLEEETDDCRNSKIEGDQNNNGKYNGGKTEDSVEKEGGKVVGGIIEESKEEDDDDNKGPQKRGSNREKNV